MRQVAGIRCLSIELPVATNKGGMASLFVLAARLLGGFCLLALSGCASLDYYRQAAAGQIELDRKARPLEDVIMAPDTPRDVVERLRWAMLMRDFASKELHLPDNASYRNYADLQRKYVLWNVVAAPEFSFEPKIDCFPIAGCLAYRGFFAQDAARRHAETLRHQGYDVWLYGVSAYSTLGWLNDPLLNTFIRYNDVDMARLIFHELAHQVVYLPDDSAFNEAFATAVEQEGIQRWLLRYGTETQRRQLQLAEQRRSAFHALLAETRQQLEQLYRQPLDPQAKRREKTVRLQQLAQRYQQFKQQWQQFGGYDHWFQPLPNNAWFVSLATYHDLVPAFRQLLRQNDHDLPRFYRAAAGLGQLPKAERKRQLAALLVSASKTH